MNDDFMIPGDVFVNTWAQYLEYTHIITFKLKIFGDF